MAEQYRTGQLIKLGDGKVYRFKGRDGEPLRQSNIDLYYDPAESEVRGAPAPRAPTTLESLGRGVEDIVGGTEQIARRVFGDPEETAAWEQRKNAELATYEQGRGPDAGFDWGRMGGQVGALAPLGVVGGAQLGLLGRAGLGAGIGAVEGGTSYVDTSQGDFLAQKGVNTLLGASGGALGGVLAPGVQRLVAKLSGPAKALWRAFRPEQQQQVLAQLQAAAEASGSRWDDLGEELQADALRKATEQLSISGQLDADAIIRRARFERLGYTGETGPMRAQVTADPRDYSELQDLYGVPEGAPAIDRNLQQNIQHHQNVQNVIGALGQGRRLGPDVLAGRSPPIARELSASEVPYAAQGVARQFERASQRQVREAYNAAKRSPGLAQLAPNFQRLNDRITEIFNEYPAGVRDQLPKRVNDLVDGVLTPSVDNIIDAFKNVNRLSSKTADPTLGSFYGEIGRTLHATLDEIAQEGGEAAAALLKANRLAAQRFGVLRGRGKDTFKSVEALINGDAKMSTFVAGRVVKGDPHEVFALRRFLTEFPEEFTYVPREAGARAWNQIRSAVLEEIAAKAKVGDSKFNEFNGRKFLEAWNDLGTMRQRALFNDEEIRFINELGTAIRDMTASPAGPKKYSKSDSSTWLRNALQSMRSNQGPIGALARKLVESPEAAAKAQSQRQLSKRAMSGDVVTAEQLDEYLRRNSSLVGGAVPAAGAAGAGIFAEQYR